MTRARLLLTNLTLALALLAAGAVVAATEQQDLSELKTQATLFLQERYAQQLQASTDTSEVTVAAPDPRLRLAKCSQALTFSARDMGNDGGAISVKAICDGEQPWSLYLSAQVDVYRNVLVTAIPLARGAVIDMAAISQQRLNTSSLRQGYLTLPDQALGLLVRRSLDVGEPLRTGVLEQPLAVKRGDIVTLESTNGAIIVATQAEALSNGRVGEQIRVKNTSSKRVVRANILGEGRVGANF
ncbi:flagellar basal body P-ring formation chaperone FlgA [Gilvimarinus polysaccharolyticus]|uniref:flagellar basal body P-ring formation chaperone FlgA n=1 Tax=Gilvimarinus polysaccharolyticus TaxID=863921 RepID=UPI000673C11B|nr:flagellar basal body P-ring formation chaperone FlgA [Gilvimarinus polysaccharolyticus]